jgi:hypothetical protein
MANFTEADLEDFVFYQDNETESLNSDSDDDLAEDVEFEMDENDIVKHLKFTEETKENFERRKIVSLQGLSKKYWLVISCFGVGYLKDRSVILDILSILDAMELKFSNAISQFSAFNYIRNTILVLKIPNF